MAGLWPYAIGSIVLPEGTNGGKLNVYFIPQKTYFPYKGTLLDAIHYPNPGNTKDAKQVITLMRSLGFTEGTINNINKKDEWNKILSGGEQQRIAIIGAIVSNPDILFMDESTNGLDPETRLACEKALKENMQGKTIIAIDHHVSNHAAPTMQMFFDHKVTIKKGESMPKIERVAHESSKLRVA